MNFQNKKPLIKPEDRQLVARLVEQNYKPNSAIKLVSKFRKLLLKLHIGDMRISKLCQIMTDHGCITFNSCEGHGKTLPMIIFTVKNSEDLMNMSHIISRNSRGTHFPWQITVFGHPGSSQPLSYILEPSSQYKIDPSQDYEKLLMDMDILALAS